MKKYVIGLLVLILLLSAALFFVLHRRPTPRSVDLLPQGTLLYVQVPNFPGARARYESTAAAQLWREPAVQEFVAQPVQALRRAWGKSTVNFADRNLERFLETVQGELFMAVPNVRLFPILQPGLVVGADLKHRIVEGRLGMAALERRLQAGFPDVPRAQKKYLGIEYTTWRPKPAWVVCHTFLGSMVIATLGEDTMRDVIARYTHRVEITEPALADLPELKRLQDELGPTPDAMACLNLQPLAMLLAPLTLAAPQGSSSFADLQQTTAIGLAVRFEDRAVRERRCTLYRPGRHAAVDPLAETTRRLTAADTVLYNVQTVDLLGAYNNVLSLLRASGRPELADAVTTFESNLRQAKLAIRDAVLAKLGREFATIVDWRPGAEFPDIAVAVDLRDGGPEPAQVQGVFETIRTTFVAGPDQPAWDQTEFRGQALHTLQFGSSRLAPTWLLTGDFLLVASTPDLARGLIARLADKPATLADQPAWQQAMQRLPALRSAAAYYDLGRLYGPLHALLQGPLAGSLPPEWGDFRQLPPPAVVAAHLFPFAAATTEGAEKKITESYSPFGTPTAVIAAGVGLGALPRLLTGGWESPAVSLPARSRRSSGTPVDPAPPENRTAESQTPSPAPPAPTP